MYQSFENLDVKLFKKCLIFLDIDGTLVADNEDVPTADVIKKTKELAEQNEVWLCSNSLNHKRNVAVKKATSLPMIKGYRKPNKKILTCVPKASLDLKMVVIGDKVLTDGFFAFRIKANFIKVKRKLGNDRFHIKLYNSVDDIAFKFFKLWGIFS
ncbi:hypothetical protein HOG48_02025 [Candidatus Peregrinibacteria bacterium]|jgi:predicted HAD superfamily phosphohydrolase YqeG|nr:hypothetical protein [Candidatus Peregrinibacteria bacterium]